MSNQQQIIKQHYLNYCEKNGALLSKNKTMLNFIAFFRFISFLLCIVLVLCGYFMNKDALYIFSGLYLILFIVLVYWYKAMDLKRLTYLSRQETFEKHIHRIEGNWRTKDTLEVESTISDDLDLFGDFSLFSFIDSCFTPFGKVTLSKYLLNHDTKEDVLIRQEAVKEMASKQGFSIELESIGARLSKKSLRSMDALIEALPDLQPNWTSWVFDVLRYIVIVSLACLVLGVFKPYSQLVFQVSVVIQLISVICMVPYYSRLFNSFKYLENTIEDFLLIFEKIKNEEFESEELKRMKDNCFVHMNVIDSLGRLNKATKLLSTRLNVFALLVLNLLFGLDHYINTCLSNWLKNDAETLINACDELSKLEAYLSLSVLKRDGFDVCVPEIKEETTLSFVNLRHPLIQPDIVKGYDFLLKEHICCITGSNMSGKTTFMRSVGLNLILAQAGGYTFAKEMSCSYMHIMTSMRIKDDVKEGYSTFYNEVLRIKEMVDYVQNNEPFICFIDEIFKGTNSKDRFIGVKGVLNHLSRSQAVVFLTTHDLEIVNNLILPIDHYHFIESYRDNKLYFDYQLRNGICPSTNGEFILKEVGLILD